jgi:hypothetical protein
MLGEIGRNPVKLLAALQIDHGSDQRAPSGLRIAKAPLNVPRLVTGYAKVFEKRFAVAAGETGLLRVYDRRRGGHCWKGEKQKRSQFQHQYLRLFNS